MIVKTEGVILKSMDFRDSSRILTVYTRDFGRQSLLAKGVRGGRSRMGGVTRPLQYVSLVYYRSEHRDLQLLSQCDLVRPWNGLTESLEAMGAAMAICELLTLVVQGEEGHPPLFELLVRCLDAVNTATNNWGNAFSVFEIRVLGLLGFRPEFRVCGGCGRALDEGDEGRMLVDAHQGSIRCGDCVVGAHEGEALSPAAHRVLLRFQEISDIGAACRITLSGPLRNEVGGILARYLQYHVEGFRALRSQAVFSQLL